MPLPRLDRVPSPPSRSAEFPMRALLGPEVAPRKRTWSPRPDPLNQGAEGACVAFAFAGELAATPRKWLVDDGYARKLYQRVRDEDRAMGNHWPDGASVLAGARACKRAGTIGSYRWCRTVEDVRDTIVRHGPVVLGVAWYSQMYDAPAGEVTVAGRLVGGHAILAHGYDPAHPRWGEGFWWVNSWGPAYGLRGRGFVPIDAFSKLWDDGGEGCVVVDKAPPPLT